MNLQKILQRRGGRAALLIGFWTVVALIYVISGFIIGQMAGREPFTLARAIWTLLGWYTWIPCTVIVLWLVHRFPIERDNWLPRLLLHVVAAPAVSFIASLLFTGMKGLEALMGGAELEAGLSDFLLGVFFRSVTLDSVIYLTLFTAVQAFIYYQKYRERELRASQLKGELAEAQLHALKMQLHPHFLFNTFHTIATLVREHRDEEAADMIANLSDLFRYVLDHAGQQEVSLRQECAFLERYLEIEKVRFRDRLHVGLHVDAEVLEAQVPGLLLQPLVENAIRHGLQPDEQSGLVEVTARREGDRVRVRVRDNGSGLPPGWQLQEAKGIGLANTKARLERLYGAHHHFDVSNASDEGGLMVTIVIPYHTEAYPATAFTLSPAVNG